MFEDEKKNYYEILDIRPDATQSEIRQAYFRAKSAYGRDSAAIYSLFDSAETKNMLERIEEAYLVLSNSERRKEYDKTHGFLKGQDELLTPRKPATSSRGVFSFSHSKNESGAAGDPAQQAAAAIFGSSEIGLEPAAPNSRAHAAAMPANRCPIKEDHSEYAVPRTLASSGATGPPIEDYVSPARENRLGIIRRTDLVKPYSKDSSFEQSMETENEFRGDFIKKVREYRGVTIEELSEFTKISRTYLNCIEAEEYDSLPAPAYLRGFIAQIAKAIKIPHDKAAAGYMKHYQSVINGK